MPYGCSWLSHENGSGTDRSTVHSAPVAASRPPRSCAELSLTGGCHKYHFCRDKRFAVTSLLLSRQTRVGHDKSNTCWSRRKFCHDKHSFVATKESVCCDRSKLVATNVLSRQKYVCPDKSFVETKIILAAAPANDTERLYEMQKAVVQPAVQYKIKISFFYSFNACASLSPTTIMCRTDARDEKGIGTECSTIHSEPVHKLA